MEKLKPCPYCENKRNKLIDLSYRVFHLKFKIWFICDYCNYEKINVEYDDGFDVNDSIPMCLYKMKKIKDEVIKSMNIKYAYEQFRKSL